MLGRERRKQSMSENSYGEGLPEQANVYDSLVDANK